MSGGTLAGLSIDWPKFSKALAGLIGAATSGNWVGVIDKAADAFGAVSQARPTPRELTIRLVATSLAVAVARTLAATDAGRRLTPDAMARAAEAALQAALPEFRFDTAFLRNPSSSPVAEQAKMGLLMLLTQQGEKPDVAFRAANDLPQNFALALTEEWKRDYERYVALERLAATPFDADLARQEAWATYLRTLEAEVEQELREIESRRPSDSTVTLASVYEPLWGRTLPDEAMLAEAIAARTQTGTGLDRLPGSGPAMLLKVDDELDDWLIRQSRCKERLRVLAGGPGSGKSSVAKMLAARRARRGEPTLFVPIHRLDLSGSAQAAIEAFVRDLGLDGFVLDDPAGPRDLLLILDGLDEIAMQGQAARDKAREVVIELARLVDRAELRARGVRVLIGGRELVVQDAAASLKSPGQVVHLVGYAPAEAEIGKKPDQRDAWWARYGRLKGQGWTGMPAWLRGKDGGAATTAVEEITDQPMLNFLLAQAMAHGVIELHQAPELATLYDGLLNAVYRRPWGDAGVRPGLSGGAEKGGAPATMAFEDFDELLQTIALAAWHGGGRAVPERMAERYAAASNLGPEMQAMREKGQGGLHGFMVAFYARRAAATDGEPAYEFTHKSFAEYLAARRLVREVLHAVRQRRAEQAARNAGWTEDVALQHLMAHFGLRALDADVVRFVPGEISRQLSGGDLDVSAVHAALVALINRSFQAGVPVDARFGALTGRNAEARMLRNLEVSLMVLRGHTSRAAGEVSAIAWPTRTFARDWISSLGEAVAHGELLARVLFDSQVLNDLRLDYADLDGARFHGCTLAACRFNHCRLASAVFEQTIIADSDFHRCDFSRATFRAVRLGAIASAGYVGQFSGLYNEGLRPWLRSDVDPPEAWNVVGDRVFVASGTSSRVAELDAQWQPPASVLIAGALDHARFENCLMIGVCLHDGQPVVRLFGERDLPDTIEVAQVHLAFCTLPRGGPLAEAAQKPVMPTERTMLFLTSYALPDEAGKPSIWNRGSGPLMPDGPAP